MIVSYHAAASNFRIGQGRYHQELQILLEHCYFGAIGFKRFKVTDSSGALVNRAGILIEPTDCTRACRIGLSSQPHVDEVDSHNPCLLFSTRYSHRRIMWFEP